MPTARLLIHESRTRHRVLDLDDIFFIEPDDHDCWVRTRAARRIGDIRRISELAKLLPTFVRIHRSYLVNPDKVRTLRADPTTYEWQLRLDPPVNRVLPISRTGLT